MPKTIPHVLSAATVSVYPQDAAGAPILAQPVWIGARIENCHLEQDAEEFESTPTGAVELEYEPGHQRHEIRFERVWVVPGDTRRDFRMDRGRYVMVVQWKNATGRTWNRRTYYGVTPKKYALAAQSQAWFGADQIFRARYFIAEQGAVGSAGELLPTAPVLTPELPILFTHDDPLVANAYLLGAYQFGGAVNLGFVKALAQGGTGGNAVLTLEINGSLTVHTLTLAAGTGEVSASATLNVNVPASQPIRWKITTAPASNAPSLLGVTQILVEQ